MKTLLISAVCLALVVISRGQSQGNANPVYPNPHAPTAERVRDLLGRMTLEEKVAQLECAFSRVALGKKANPLFTPDGLDGAKMKDLAGHGLGTYGFLDEFTATGDTADPRVCAERRNQLQRWVLENTRLGIPIMFHGEALHGAVRPGATSFPQAVALGSTWNPELIEEMFSVVAREARASGNTLVLSPVLDLSRDPRYGRSEEMYSEDPYLVGEMGVAAVRGLQGINAGDRLDPDRVFATAKHFVHGQPENGTNIGPSDYSERTMRAIFLYPFEQVVRRVGIEAVMPSYNETGGGIPSSANPWLLKEVLRKEWGFKGLMTSDYNAVEELSKIHRVAADRAEAALLAFQSGVDMELPQRTCFPHLVDAVKTGKLSEKSLNEAVERVLSAKFRAGLFENPYVDEVRAATELGKKESGKLARQVADEAVVLLQNKANLMPLDSTKINTLAVIGPNGKKMRLGTYSGVPPYYVSVVDGIQNRVGQGTKVVFAEGCQISRSDTTPQANFMGLYRAPDDEADRKLIEEAIETARSADVVVLALGGNELVSREAINRLVAGDSDTIELPGRQNELVRAITKLGKPVVAVVLGGKAYAIEQLAAEVPAILQGWYLGQETGSAIAGILFGDVNPSGHLPVTIARNVGQLPVYYYRTPAARRGYVFHDNSPLFPFGHGLSYTTFDFEEPTLDRDQIAVDESAKVSVKVTNSGSRPGDEIVQMYIHYPVSSVVQPDIMLRGFKRIHLEPGASTTVTFDVGPEQISIWDAQMQKIVESGPVEILIGASSVETSSVRMNVTH